MHRPLLLLSILTVTSSLALPALALPALDLPPSAQINEDTPGQVTINDDPTSNSTTTHLPISARIFTGVPGPTHCRGRILQEFILPPPPISLSTNQPELTQPRCIDLPTATGAGCGVFTANKKDGCVARLFAEAGCRMFVNLVVFVPEERTVGGVWRSMAVQCGVEEPSEESLGQVPFAGLLEGARRRPKGG